jgi:hypothetical protein
MSDTCEGFNCTGSEMGHLWHVALGNAAGALITNTGDFQNFQPSYPHASYFLVRHGACVKSSF